MMKQGILFAGAVALAFAGAASAKPPHAGQGKGHGAAKSQHGRDIAAGRIGQRGFGDQYGRGSQYGVGLGGCPPGHSKHPGVCMPHGQWKKQFEVGQRLPLGYKGLLGYDALPYDMRSRYGSRLDPYSRYAYDDQYLYRVDPKTMIVSEVLRGLLYR